MSAAAVIHAVAETHKIVCSSRNGAIRVSLHVYNDDSDIAALVAALNSRAPPK